MGGTAGDRRGQRVDAVTTAVAPQLTLTDDQLQVAGARVGVQSFPAVLGIRSRYPTIDQREAAFDRATQELSARGLIADGGLDQELVQVLHALQRPQREMAMRLVTPEGIARTCVVRRGPLCVLARRIGNEITLRSVGIDCSTREVTAALLGELPAAAAADVAPIGAPQEAMSESLLGTHDPAVLADRIRGLGAENRAAMVLGSALGSRQAFAEIVYYYLAEDNDRIGRAPAAVAVMYTKRGRIVGAPSVSPAGQIWVTLKAGSDHAIGQAISQLVELSAERWGDS